MVRPAAPSDSSPLTVAYPALPKPMTVGDASVEHRPSVAPGESTFVRLTVAGAAELSALKTQPVAHNSPSDSGFVYKLSPQIDLYPWMWAHLQDAPAAFTVQQESAAAARAEIARRNDNIASIGLVILISVGCVAALLIASRCHEGTARR